MSSHHSGFGSSPGFPPTSFDEISRPKWLPSGKDAAVCFTIDDVHPGKSTDPYEAGGDLGRGALGYIERLLKEHPQSRVTLFVTADWREIAPHPTRSWLARVPGLREKVYLTRIRPLGTMRVDRHPEFIEYLNGLAGAEIGFHGLYHVHKGPRVVVEFQGENVDENRRTLREMREIFGRTTLKHTQGLCPPGWNAPPALLAAMADEDFHYVASARDIVSPVTESSKNSMSGVRGASLIYPEFIAGTRLVHFTTNFQATSPLRRALEIIDRGGLLAIKAHIVKLAHGHMQLDGVDGVYTNFLDLLYRELDRRYGATLWWTSMDQISQRIRSQGQSSEGSLRSNEATQAPS